MDRSQITESKQIFLTEPERFVLAFCTSVHAATGFRKGMRPLANQVLTMIHRESLSGFGASRVGR